MTLNPKFHRRAAMTMAERYLAVRAQTEMLAAPLSPEDQNLQSMPDASPVKWHRAHTTWFFETFLLKPRADYAPFDPAYEYLFNSYYEAVGPRHPRPQRGLLSRPSASEVSAYRRHVDAAMSELLAEGDENLTGLIELGLNHEQQHQELLLTDILHAFAQSPLKPAWRARDIAPGRPPETLDYIRFDGGEVSIGHAGDGFAFDNEGPRHQVLLRPFAISNRLATNGEWLEFVEAGGYQQPQHWLADGWATVNAQGWRAPLYWSLHEGVWHQMTLAGLQPLDLAAPVAHVSYYEADAYARFRGKRLPTEFEWEHAANHCGQTANLFDADVLHPKATRAAKGVLAQMFGDVWEWTGSAYLPYPGFRASADAVGEYNGKFMINQMVLRGGSCITPEDHIRASYRNFFYPHMRWQFSGVRLADDAPRVRARTGAVVRNTQMLRDVWSGLAKPQKALSAKYFYDAEGSRLFEEITSLPEYYPTRTETALLKDIVSDLADAIAPGTALVEFGSGSSTKTRILLDNIAAIDAYVPLDINLGMAEAAAREFREAYPSLEIVPLGADFMREVALPVSLIERPLLGFFPGSTIGNLEKDDAVLFLRRARETLGDGGKLLIGIDLVKDVNTLLSAYDDSQGVTAAFNKNVLARINRELGGDFDLDAFAHLAVWNAEGSRIEMHLVSLKAQTVTVSGRSFEFAEGETIHTENSHKYTIARFTEMAALAGWRIERRWTSEAPEFAVLLLG
ncbi:MAG: L-histidine N(alpha)-methyltransferase [Alphaproteobacteria bacterium]|nr:L-histidine N(alpha)-methyltransferase [Alphaproteobacteria bacterium]